MTFTHGELFERSFESEGRIVELLAEIVIVEHASSCGTSPSTRVTPAGWRCRSAR